MPELPRIDGLLIVPRLRIQNANAISSPMTWGFPSMTAFLGLMWKLERLLAGDIAVMFNGIGVVCHAFEPQVSRGGFTKSFCLTRNPVGKDGGSASIVEEGRVHLEVTPVFGVVGDILTASTAEREAAAAHVAGLMARMRVAGGTVLPGVFPRSPQLVALEEDEEKQAGQIRAIRRMLLPGSCLVERNDLLERRHQQHQATTPETSRLDAWLDLARTNWRSVVARDENGTETVTWQHDRSDGWIVPIPLGYAGLTDLEAPGTVLNARDTTTPFRFVESIYGIGQWVGAHRLKNMHQMLWYASADDAAGMYRCCNDYTQYL